MTHDYFLPFLAEKEIDSYDKKIQYLFSSNHPLLIDFILDALLRYRISSAMPSQETQSKIVACIKANKVLFNSTYNSRTNIIKLINFYLGLGKTFRIGHRPLSTKDFRDLNDLFLDARESLISNETSADIDDILISSCVSLNKCDFFKSCLFLQLLKVKMESKKNIDKMASTFLIQSLRFIKSIKPFLMTERLTWELTLLKNHDKIRYRNRD